MIVHCPQCETVFAMPDEAYRPGRKVRCSQCTHVFPLPEIEVPPSAQGSESLDLPKVSKKRKFSFALTSKYSKKLLYSVFALVIVAIGVGGYVLVSNIQSSRLVAQEQETKEMVAQRRVTREKEAQSRAEDDALVESINLVDVRQMVVRNDNLGPLVVIQGYARNNFDTPREFIMVEGRLLDKSGNVLTSGSIYCGINLSLTQLQVLTQDELKKALNDKVSVLANNVDIAPGQQVPFLLVFIGVPNNLFSFEVRPLSAQLVKTN